MPTTFSGRLFLIFVIVFGAIYCIIPQPSKLFDHKLPFLQKTNLRPGIDMVGGVSLIYQIQPADNRDTNGLAERVMEVLKNRIDPNGVQNYVWRPQGNTRLEIQLPLTGDASEVKKKQKAYSDAQQNLDATNIRQDAVINAVEHLAGNERQERLAPLAMDSKTRQELFKDLIDTFDQIQTLRANKDNQPVALLATKLQPLVAKYESLKTQVEQTNLSSSTLESILDQKLTDKNNAQPKLDALRKKYADFPSRLKAIDEFEASYDGFQTVKSAVTDATDLKRKLQGSGVLEFHILADSSTANPADIQRMNQRLDQGGRGPLPQPGDTMRWMVVDRAEEFDRPGAPPETREWNGKHYILVIVTPDASMDRSNENWGLAGASAEQDTSSGEQVVSFRFNPVGGNLFGKLTEDWYNRTTKHDPTTHARLAIVLDNKVVSAPNLNSAITGGSGQISGGGKGGFSPKDLDYLVSTLNAGSLPAQLSSEPISEEQVGPSIGLDNLYRGLIACGFGLIVVAVFLISYYYLAGIVAFIAVVLNLILILGTMAGFGATFTLPSIAAIVLTVGTAVDANVLIFERLREEQHKGLSLRMALRNSYDRAFSAIVDSNMTSAITSLFLYMFGSEEVKGFGLTLLIGIVASLFTSLYVTKTIFGIMIDKWGVTHLGSLPLTFPKLDKALKPNWDWMGKAWIFYSFSIIMISIGLVLFVMKVHQGKMMAIEFTSGTSVQFELKSEMEIEKVRSLIDAQSRKDPQSLPNPSVVSVGSEKTHYEVVTSNVDREQVKQAVLDAMAGDLKLAVPSTFELVNTPIADARGKAVLPIREAGFAVDGFMPPAAADHVGEGVAIVLRGISPKLTPGQIASRLENERFSSGGLGSNNISYKVQAPTDDKTPTDFAVIVGWNPSVSYTADESRWGQELAEPLWKLASQGIDRPPSLEKENNFDAQVANEMQRDAFLSLAFSIAVIMIYIWVRFGNLKYGTATVVALLHDTVFTVAAMGFAHYIYQYWPNNFLQIEPFRIDLTVVAGILTIMGYSMIDTIVVFDRIRENRGKYGHLDRQVINDAINQTLSRTLLTAGTTIITVSFMYFLGGSGIHGFTFVLLIGILVGTYSSVAIAAPLLLVGKETATVGTTQVTLGQYQQTPVGQG